MEEYLDRDAMIERARGLARDIRRSEAYPAIIGGIAGGIAGALMAVIIASRSSPRHTETITQQPSTDSARGGMTPKDLVQLLGVAAGLVRQAREWYYQERGKK